MSRFRAHASDLLPARLLYWARCAGPAPALEVGGRRLTYAELSAAVERAASWLAARRIGPGQRVLLRQEKGLATVLLVQAALRSGVVAIPVHPRATVEELAALQRDADAHLLVVDRGAEELARGACWPGAHERAVATAGPAAPWPAAVPATPWAAVDPGEDFAALTPSRSTAPAPDARPLPSGDDIACLLYTSGTTGRPKGVVLRHGQIAANTGALAAAWALGPADVLLHVLPLFHVHGLFVALGGVLAAGGCVRLLERFDADDVWQELGDGITLCMGVPTMYHRLVAQAPAVLPDLSRVRLFLSGSAPLDRATAEAFAVLTGRPLVERYGLTETLIATSQSIAGDDPPGSVGAALPGVELSVVGPDGRPRATGEVGEVLVGGPSVFDGYWRDPEATDVALRDGRMATGDLGFLDGQGRLFLVGRSKELIISGGFNVYPREVEAALEEHPAVAEAAVCGLPDGDLGELVAAGVVLRPGATATVDELLAFGRRRLMPSKAPRRIALLDALPRNALGKLQRTALARHPAFAR